MARPTYVTVPAGVENWQEEINTDLAVVFDAPFPLYQSTTSRTLAAFTTAFPAASYDRCLAWHNDSDLGTYILLYSDGAKWKPVGRPYVRSAASAAGALAVDADTLGDRGTLRTALTENITYGAPTGGYDGQIITLEPKQHASTGPYTVAFNAIYRFGLTVVAPTMTVTASKRDAYMFKYHAADNKWDAYAVVQSF